MDSMWTFLWILIGSIGVTLIGLAVLGKYSGTSDLITAVMSIINIIVNFIRTGVSFILNNLPKPVKVFIVILVVAVFGGWLYTFTVGMHYVCIPDESVKENAQLSGRVYETDSAFGGLIIRLWPEDLRGNEVLFDNTTQPSVATLGLFGFDPEQWRLGQDNDVLKMETRYINGKNYRVLYMLATDARVVTQDDVSTLVRKPAKEQFTWLFGDLSKTYDVCYDEVTQTCVLQVAKSMEESGCRPVSVTSGVMSLPVVMISGIPNYNAVQLFRKDSIWNKQVGRFNYYFDDESEEFVALIRDDGYLTDNLLDTLWNFRILSLADCKGFEQSTLPDDVTVEEVESRLNKVMVHAANNDFPLYNAARGVFKVTCEEQTDPECSPKYFAETDLITKTQAIAENFKLMEQSEDDVLKYVCNSETSDQYDIKVEIGGDGTPGSGIDPFSMSTLLVFATFSAMFAVYMFIKNL
jgi:hypothetical protein